MNIEIKIRIKETGIFCGILILAILGMHIVGITCPIKWMTGISCPGCGMTRAWIQVFQLHFSQAFYYHPLWFMILPILFLFVFQNKIPDKIYKFILITILLLFLIVYVYRMFTMQDIVVFSPEKGMVYRILHFLFTK